MANKKVLFWNLRKIVIFEIWKWDGFLRAYVIMSCSKCMHLSVSLERGLGSRNKKLAFQYIVFTVALNGLSIVCL